ncbi:MAG: Xaa-Pro peptidase family protein [Methanoregulaceae archaeon]
MSTLMDALDEAIRSRSTGAYVAYGPSADPDLRYLTRFRTGDPVPYIRKPGEKGIIIVPQMEYEHAARESVAIPLTRTSAGLPEILKTEKDPWKALAAMIANQIEGDILVPPTFPVALAEALRGFRTISIDSGTVEIMRAIKTDEEIEKIRAVQEAAQESMAAGVRMIKKSQVRKGVLYLNGEPLTSERVRAKIHKKLLDFGCKGVDTIVSCAKDTALPHMEGAGPLLAEEPIIIDIFPQSETTGYVADMTRTVSKGKPDQRICEMYDAVREAQDIAAQLVAPGAQGPEIHQAVVDHFKERGFESNTQGFIHNLGHGVGLAVHELPSLGPNGGVLAEGHVITLEPGLYYMGTGGIRLEDMGAVTKTCFDRFTRFPRELIL